MHDLVNTIKGQITNSPKDSVHLEGKGDVISLVVEHEIPDFSQTRLLQPVPKRSEIEFHMTKDGIQVRRSVDTRAREAVEKFDVAIKKKLETNSKKLERKIIDIDQLITAKSRIQFFFDLMDGLHNMEYHNMLGVAVSKFDEELSNEEEEGKHKKIGDAFKSFIRKADFSGEGLRSNPEISRFLSQGFFVSACTIEAIADDPKLGSVVFRCGFAEEADVRIFEYKILSVRPIDGDAHEKKRSPTTSEQARISNWINATAFESIEKNRNAKS